MPDGVNLMAEPISDNPRRRTSLTAGLFYLLTFVSIPTLSLYSQVHNPNYIVGPGPDTAVIVGAILEWIVALSGIGTAVALYSVVKKQNEGFALGFVGSRVLEASTILVGIGCLLTIVTLRQAGDETDGQAIGQVLVAMYDRMFLLGQSLMPAVNALLLGTLLYRSRLVPRILPLLGLVGAPLLVSADVAILFGIIDRLSVLAAVTALPIALWEFSLGIWLTVKGFSPSAIASLEARVEN
jgi:hypothetical protein